MFVAASSRCFADLPLDAALLQLVELEYSAVEIMIHETDGHMKPSDVLADPERAVTLCRQTHRLTPVALSVDIEAPEPDYYHQFAACCRLAKAIKVVTITVRSAELGTPFNAEVERLRTLVALAAREGVRVGLLTEVGRMTENARHGRGDVRQRQGAGHHARSEPLHLRPARRGELRAGDEARLPRAAPRHHQGPVAGPRRPGRGRVRPAGQPIEQGPLRPGAVRRHAAHARGRSAHRNAQDAAAAGEPAVELRVERGESRAGDGGSSAWPLAAIARDTLPQTGLVDAGQRVESHFCGVLPEKSGQSPVRKGGLHLFLEKKFFSMLLAASPPLAAFGLAAFCDRPAAFAGAFSLAFGDGSSLALASVFAGEAGKAALAVRFPPVTVSSSASGFFTGYITLSVSGSFSSQLLMSRSSSFGAVAAPVPAADFCALCTASLGSVLSPARRSAGPRTPSGEP